MGGRTWTGSEDYQLLGLAEQALSLQEIARVLGRSVGAVAGRLTTLGVSLRGPGARGYTVCQVARLLGLDWHRVADFVRRGWLRARVVPLRTATFRLIAHDQLLRFLADDRYWHLWEPERIRDGALREWAQELRGDVRFLTVAEAARLLHMTPGAINRAIREGRLPAVRKGAVGAPWRVRSDQLVLAPERRRGRGPTVTDQERAYVRTWWGRKPAATIGRELGRPGSTVCAIAARLGLPRLGRGYWRTASHMRDPERWLTVDEAAHMLGISATRVRDYVRDGRLDARDDGGQLRIDRVSVQAEARRRYHRYVRSVLTA